MVNFGLNPASLLGIALAVAGAGLYFLRSFRPELSRDHDIFFAAVGLLCGLILLSQGWRLDPILQFGQFLLAGSTIFFAFESIRLRGVATEQAKRSTPIVDDERPVSRVYRAELDELEFVEERSTPRRIRGTKETRPSRGEEYEEESYRRPPMRSSERPSRGDTTRGDDLEGESSRSRRRRPRLEDASDITDDRRTSDQNLPSASSRPSRRGGSSSRTEERGSGYDPDSTTPSRSRRPRPSQETDFYKGRREEPNSTEYVDYKPIDYDDDDNSSNFNP